MYSSQAAGEYSVAPPPWLPELTGIDGLPADMLLEAQNLNRLQLREQLYTQIRRQIGGYQYFSTDTEQ